MVADVPAALQEQLDMALNEVRTDPEHALSPARRYAIYQAIGPNNDARAVRVRGYLAVAAARRVLDLWERWAKPQEEDWDAEVPARLITMSERVLSGAGDAAAFTKDASDYWYVAGNVLDDAVEYGNVPFEAAFAFNAAVICANETPGAQLRGRVPRTLDRPDESENFIEGQRDTASAAVMAEAGAEWTGRSDPEARLRFWEWWLLEAVPTAWTQAQREVEK
jgi:hypothetical protein